MGNSKKKRLPNRPVAPEMEGEVCKAREQTFRRRGRSDTGTLTEQGKPQQITLKNGAVVNARDAVAVVEQLQIAQEISPHEFKTLLALAENRPQDVDPRHFEDLKACAFLEDDSSIDPTVRDVLLNCYQVTPEGPVVAPLRLQDGSDVPIAQREAERMSQQFRDMLRKPRKGGGPSMD